MEPMIIFGAGGHAKVVAQTLRRLHSFELLGFIDDVDPTRKGEAFGGATILGGREVLPALLGEGIRTMAIAFGANEARLQRSVEMSALGFAFPPLIDPTAVVSDDVRIEAGSYIASGAIVQPGASLGRQVIVNTGAIVEHDCRVEDGVHLCPRSCLAGHVHVGRCTWIGAGTVVRDRIKIGADTFIGIGALVVADVPSGILAYGHPARQINKASS